MRWKKLIPSSLVGIYHLLLAFVGAILYRFPSRRIRVVAVTGTKGKTTVTELVSAMCEHAGHATALSNTVRFKIGGDTRPNRLKMTTPGRFFLQKFLRAAVQKKCTYAILEMSSEGAAQSRHRFIDLDALIFTNLAPEHIESHGSFEAYRDAKLAIARALARSPKPQRILVANADDPEHKKFQEAARGCSSTLFSLADARPYELGDRETAITLWGESVYARIPGVFNIANILAAANAADALGIPRVHICRAIEKFSGTPGRVQFIDAGQPFSVIVDYAHTIESLRAVYGSASARNKICVLGSTGGGRDTWKRPGMGAVAAENCSRIILANEDPYDEDPENILNDIAAGITAHSAPPPQKILDRRKAIREALAAAGPGDAVFITGKGTDPYIMGPGGSKQVWSDADVAREELAQLGYI